MVKKLKRVRRGNKKAYSRNGASLAKGSRIRHLQLGKKRRNHHAYARVSLSHSRNDSLATELPAN
eukprot:scaffold2252_cov255-Pinguiococcus_pyrenoidosus.AAC.5